MAIVVRTLSHHDYEDWLKLRQLLWSGEIAEHRAETATYFVDGTLAGLPHRVFVAETTEPTVRLIGFAECSHRETGGAASPRHAHLEGWYVAPSFRRIGVGRLLIDAAIVWAKSIGCNTLTSDTSGRFAELSKPAHLACGFNLDPAVAARLGPPEDGTTAIGFSRDI